MDGMSLVWILGLGMPVLALHLVSIALTKAIQSYSRSLLEARCADRGHPELLALVEHWDHKTERATEAVAVLTGLLLAALMGLGVGLATSPPGAIVVILPVLAIGLCGYVIAGVIGKVFAEVIVDVLWPAAGLLRTLAFPLTFGLRQVERLVESLSGRAETLHRPAHLQVEIPVEDDAPDEYAEPELPESARIMLQHAVVLTRTDVGELMTPRSSIVSLPSTVSAAEAAATFRRTGLSRVPVFEESRDDIVGVLYAKDLFARMTEARAPSAISPRDLVRPVHFVPESKNAFDLLEELRTQRTHFAVVLDEYGSVAGLVTLEDLLEELVGPIDDEHDTPSPADPIRKLGGSRHEVEASLTLDLLNDRLGLQLPTDGEFQTIGGLVFHELGRLPRKGDRVNACGVAFTVVEVSDHTIRRLMIDLAQESVPVESKPTGSSK
jgi:CBS domain containing-hemolysin-like protein